MSEAFDVAGDGPESYVPNSFEVHLYPDDAAAWAVRVPPGTETGQVLALLDPARLSQAGRVDAMVAAERLCAWASAMQARMITALVEAPPPTTEGAPRIQTLRAGLDRGWAKEDVRISLGESTVGARSRINVASELVHRLPATLDALEAGRITARHAMAVTDTVAVLGDSQAAVVEQAVIPAPGRPGQPVPVMSSFRKKLRRAADKADPRTAAERAARAAADRDVWVISGQDAMAYIGAPLPAEGAATVMAAVTAKGEQIKEPDDARTKAQRRADALVQLCADYLAGTGPGCTCKAAGKINPATSQAVATRAGADAPRYHGLRPQIQVSVALSTLLGIDEQPGELDGYGPIPADVARRIAADPTGTWRRLVTDQLGRLVDYGRTVYKPPADLARHVIARDRTCTSPGCTRPAAQSDLHHVIAFSRGGATNAANLTATCERHHYAVHDGHWKLVGDGTGAMVWTSPTGHTYTTEPAGYPIDRTRGKIKATSLDAGTEVPLLPPF